ncbi:hypothetical protein SMD44_04404 [Streptomyces alboflavus]|uniref:Uncharacterized protein n=1 Tax=Streptomyces alboflavus TaxID=67267 RepID=A0A1Z1WES4_9ACTN|nr:hypothetical protein SMD44_04404 [Streptomyces alboflavus]
MLAVRIPSEPIEHKQQKALLCVTHLNTPVFSA